MRKHMKDIKSTYEKFNTICTQHRNANIDKIRIQRNSHMESKFRILFDLE